MKAAKNLNILVNIVAQHLQASLTLLHNIVQDILWEVIKEDMNQHYKTTIDVDGDKCNIISDGIVNPKEYYESEIKILWILKEPYDKDNEGAGGWPITDLLNDKDNDFAFLKILGGAKTTWYPIIYVTYAILNEFVLFDNMDDIEKLPEMAHILRKIAFINVQKFPAGTTTNNSDIQKAYKEHSEILLQQIATYKPDIIIGGNTLSYFIQDLGLTDAHKDYDENYFWIKDNQLFIHAGHPSQRGSAEDKENYVDDIVRVAKKFYQKENK